jgi:hypothetical protein
LKGKAFDKIQKHYESALQDAREEFELKFPDTKRLLAEDGVTNTQKAFQSALGRLLAPNVRRDALLILAAFAPPDQIEEAVRAAKQLGAAQKVGGNDIQTFLTASDAYVQAMDAVQNKVREHLDSQPGLPAIAKDLFERAAVLTSLGADLDDLFWKTVPMAVFPMAEEALLDILWASQLFTQLGNRLRQFGAEVEGRHQEYRTLLNSLNADFERVNREVLKWN